MCLSCISLPVTHECRGTLRSLLPGVAAYALSPIDLIPDFIPVLGYLDDVIIVPLGIVLALRLIPPSLLKNIDTQPSSAAKSVPRVMSEQP